MSYREKGSWVYLVVTIGSFAVYAAIIASRAGGRGVTTVAYAAPLLWTVGISVVASTLLRTMVETARPSDSHRADARDRDVNRFGEHIGGTVLAVAMTVPFVLALLRADYFWIANAIYAAFTVWAVVSTATKLLAYRRGL
jgi:hypothetical protein